MRTEVSKRSSLTKTLQDNKTVSRVKYLLVALCLIVAGIYFFKGISEINKPIPEYRFTGIETFERVTEAGEEEYEDETVCPVEFA
ncbi:MAG: hypothetical protein IKZ39_00400, partial [Lachnospiraceae bacterium]|nr:hypothetical protein [Lachnospiraceae bacterium]